MKDGLENIDEIFKQAFDGFEANVDPNVWANVQNSIGGGAGATDVTPKADPVTATTVATKSVLTKIAVGVALVGTLGTAGYFIATDDGTEKSVVEENTIAENRVETVIPEEVETVEPLVVETENQQKIEPKQQQVVIKDDVIQDEVETTENLNDKAVSEANDLISEATPEETVTSNNANDSQPAEVNAKTTNNSTANSNSKTQNAKDSQSKSNNNDKPIVTPEPKPENKKEAVVDVIPNVISPNGDGLNDGLKITGENLKAIELVVMDNSGKPVYKITSLEDEWVGKDQAGFDLPQGTYYIAGVVVNQEGSTKNIKQKITLFR